MSAIFLSPVRCLWSRVNTNVRRYTTRKPRKSSGVYQLQSSSSGNNESIRFYSIIFPMKRDVRIVLHNIRSAHNVGSIFRTADALGVTRVYCSGYTPSPLDRFGRPVKEIAKTALGAEESIPWEILKRPNTTLRALKHDGFTIIGIEQDKRAQDYKNYIPPEKVVILVGNEVRGLSSSLRSACDILVEIPMQGKKESLNVAVSFGVAAFRLLDH